ncbi:hypothetical protein L1987_67595 [Smallanthus sonchifolius]|uniref:Uncharacterized protein n=1 Tax=Smallanthus sonchifolius TaxID=185202 RepID=A0ACB9B4A2_9ASTR|nr:hypothetical protein L1987_67595 [Smallanthus sonchifolius]
MGSKVTTRGGKENVVGLVDFNDLDADDHLASDNEVENNYEMGLNNSRRIESNGETHITPSGESTDVSWNLNCEPALVGDHAHSKEERPVRPDIIQSSRSVGSESETCEVEATKNLGDRVGARLANFDYMIVDSIALERVQFCKS